MAPWACIDCEKFRSDDHAGLFLDGRGIMTFVEQACKYHHLCFQALGRVNRHHPYRSGRWCCLALQRSLILVRQYRDRIGKQFGIATDLFAQFFDQLDELLAILN